MKNWKTTLTGIILGGGVSIDALIAKGLTEGWHQALIGLAIAVLGVLSKDHDVSGAVKKPTDDGTGQAGGTVGNRPDDRNPNRP